MIVAAMDQPNSPFTIMLLFSLVVLACFWAWAGIAARHSRGDTLVPYVPRRPAPWTVVDVVLIVVAYVLLTTAIGWALTRSDGAQPDEDPAKAIEAYTTIRLLSASALSNIVSVLFAIGLLSMRTGATKDDLGFAGGQLAADLLLGVTAFAAVSVPIYALQFALTRFFPSRHPVVSILEIDHGPLTMAWVALIAVVIAPIAEEFLFRVVMQGWLEAAEARHCGRSGLANSSALALTETDPTSAPALTYESQSAATENPYQSPGFLPAEGRSTPQDIAALSKLGFADLPVGLVPIVATSAVFALLHAGHGPDPIPLFLLALVLGFLYQRTHRVLPGIVLHMCLNGTSMLMFWMGGGG